MPVERNPARDALLPGLAAAAAAHGWNNRAVQAAAVSQGLSPTEAQALFDGPLEMIEAYIDHADRRMQLAAAELPPLRLSQRVRAVVGLRLKQAQADRPAIRRALALLALPPNALVAARTLSRTVDAIWHAAGDTSTDISWYTKRAILAGIYTATLLHWLSLDETSDPGDVRTLAFLDRRLAVIGRIGTLRGRLGSAMARCRPNAAAAV